MEESLDILFTLNDDVFEEFDNGMVVQNTRPHKKESTDVFVGNMVDDLDKHIVVKSRRQSPIERRVDGFSYHPQQSRKREAIRTAARCCLVYSPRPSELLVTMSVTSITWLGNERSSEWDEAVIANDVSQEQQVDDRH